MNNMWRAFWWASGIVVAIDIVTDLRNRGKNKTVVNEPPRLPPGNAIVCIASNSDDTCAFQWANVTRQDFTDVIESLSARIGQPIETIAIDNGTARFTTIHITER